MFQYNKDYFIKSANDIIKEVRIKAAHDFIGAAEYFRDNMTLFHAIALGSNGIGKSLKKHAVENENIFKYVRIYESTTDMSKLFFKLKSEYNFRNIKRITYFNSYIYDQSSGNMIFNDIIADGSFGISLKKCPEIEEAITKIKLKKKLSGEIDGDINGHALYMLI